MRFVFLIIGLATFVCCNQPSIGSQKESKTQKSTSKTTQRKVDGNDQHPEMQATPTKLISKFPEPYSPKVGDDRSVLAVINPVKVLPEIAEQRPKPVVVRSNKELTKLYEKGDFESVKYLQILNAYRNDPIGDVDLSKFTNVEYLDIKGLKAVPSSLSTCTKLKTLEITGREYSKPNVAAIGHLKALEYLNIANSNIVLPQSLKHHDKLSHLHVENKEVQQDQSIIFSLENLKSLIYITDKAELRGVERLKQLTFLKTNVVDERIAQCELLKGLVFYNAVTMSYPANLASLKHLEALQLSGNQHMETAPEFVSTLPKLRFLEFLQNINLKAFPTSYNNLKNLEYLKIVQRPNFDGDLSNISEIASKIQNL